MTFLVSLRFQKLTDHCLQHFQPRLRHQGINQVVYGVFARQKVLNIVQGDGPTVVCDAVLAVVVGSNLL